MNRTDHPNILIILADDHGYGDVSMHQGPHIQTPNMDRMVHDGDALSTLLRQLLRLLAHRAALMTGRYPDRVGVPGRDPYPRRKQPGLLPSGCGDAADDAQAGGL